MQRPPLRSYELIDATGTICRKSGRLRRVGEQKMYCTGTQLSWIAVTVAAYTNFCICLPNVPYRTPGDSLSIVRKFPAVNPHSKRHISASRPSGRRIPLELDGIGDIYPKEFHCAANI